MLVLNCTMVHSEVFFLNYIDDDDDSNFIIINRVDKIIEKEVNTCSCTTIA